MPDFVLDSDPFIPTGTEATPARVAELLAADVLPVESVAQLAERQQPDVEQLTAAAEASEQATADVLAKFAPLIDALAESVETV